MKVSNELDKLEENDIYSLILFVLYKMREIPEYSALCELIYVIDKESLLKLCEYFGGLTITIPTIDELKQVIQALTLYQYVAIEGKEVEEAVGLLNCNHMEKRKTKALFYKICEILDKYDFCREDVYGNKEEEFQI